VDDHALIREGLKHFLEAHGFEWLGEAVNGQQAVQAYKRLQPDVVLMDLFMPVMNGIEATQHIRQDFPAAKIVIMTSEESCDHITDALRAGAVNYILKGISLDTFAQVIHSANEGQFHVTDESAHLLVSAFKQNHTVDYHLTQREEEVIELLSQGWSNQQIAAKLVISISTVKNHISSIYKKMDVTSRSAAVANAVRYKII
jgi:DNA-binding NarL/FixJ family response regulator